MTTDAKENNDALLTDSIKDQHSNKSRSSKHDLLLSSLGVKNFRAFRDLSIPKLGRINLVTGKNNVGKTALLESLFLYSQRGSAQAINQLLTMREEVPARPFTRTLEGSRGFVRQPLSAEQAMQAALSLFHDTLSLESRQTSLSVGEVAENSIKVYLHWLAKVSSGSESPTLKIISADALDLHDAHLYFTVREGTKRIRRFRVDRALERSVSVTSSVVPFSCETVWTSSQQSSNLELQYSKILQDDNKDILIDVLSVIIPEVKDIEFITTSSTPRVRKPHLRLKNAQGLLPLARVGDGTTRLLSFAMALLNASKGFLLIDEIENGIHYTVLPGMWRWMFDIARDLDIQVFATTHSWDCIESFQMASSEDEKSEGVLVRLLNKRGDVLSTVFDERSLKIVTRDGIEVR